MTCCVSSSPSEFRPSQLASSVGSVSKPAGKTVSSRLTTALRWVGAATALTATAGAATAAAANREIRQFQLHQVEVPLLAPGTLPRGRESFRILHISDFHMLAHQQLKQEWVAALDTVEPDLVVNTGDNLGEAEGVPGVLRAVDPLLRRPGVFVFGSNDYFAPRPVNPFIYLLGKKRKPSHVELPWRGMRAAFVEHGWGDATNARLEFPLTVGPASRPGSGGKLKLAIAGVDDPHHDLDDYDRIAGEPNPAADLSIGLSHSPEPAVVDRFAADGYQLVLSGHTHGGQLCLPGGRAIVTNCGIDRGRVAGLSRWTERTWLHVTNGLGNSKYVPFRTFCRPSATLIHVVEKPRDSA
ncbi:MAG TPA: metallophosphoesterase [Candidatus Corynebacterium gallistercoris]|uniref:Metallophosphoesterase n=1 Tax=Candidatus Corynebacterium gallistercoris TaxID=2838530 RepID=A0A9D1RZV1_9CORY|nr:metallophosphoesterase [Candidatus Corynebacterium gallistercoris]